MKNKVLFLVNQDGTLFNFRRELVFELLERGYDVYISSPYGPKLDPFINKGAHLIEIKFDRRGINVFREAKVVWDYFRLMRKVRPDVVLTYTSKCSVYGGFVCTLKKIPYIINNCGLFDPNRFGKWMDRFLNISYRITYSKAACLMCQNITEQNYLNARVSGKPHYRLIPGSGVNLSRFQPTDYPSDDTTRFVLICRIQKEKGIEEYLAAASYIKPLYPNTEFHILGNYDEDYHKEVEDAESKGYVKYHGAVADVIPYLKNMHCLVNPSYHEGMSNVILEANAMCRPAIASDCMGCNDIITHNYNGLLVNVADATDLAKKIEMFINLPYKDKVQMGLNARYNVEENFDRMIVTNCYVEEIERILGKQ